MTFAAQGNVTGTVLDQYSMDESGSNFRVITTAYIYDNDSFMGMEQTNVYVLDMDLNTVGKLEGIAPGENFYSSRFMSNRLYLVTFYTIDPLFVIDLTQATNPRILGNLTIPGYSGFMQPYDETHIIGIGKDANVSIDADKVHTQGAIYYTAILGLKLSFFDVSDITVPKEIAKIVIGDQGTDSQALYDPHAFLLDSSKNLLVIPINLYMNQTVTAPKLGETAVPSPTANDSLIVPTPTSAPGFSEPSSYPMMVWQGVYVFKVTLTGGFEVRGNVTQLSSEQLANLAQGGYYYYGSYDNGYNYWITRSLYIGNTLYTISNARVQLNSLTDMALQATVELS
jgi:uncharacterized secreted protein with C-terminal beta-propeller domain